MTAISPHETFRQRGAAAVEFALVLPVLLMLLWGLVTFAAMFYTQLAVSRAASDGARVAATADSPDMARVRQEVIESLAASAIVPRASNHSIEARRVWLNDNVIINPTQTACSGGAMCVVVTVRYPYHLTRVLPPIELPLFGQMSWMPDTIVAEAIALR